MKSKREKRRKKYEKPRVIMKIKDKPTVIAVSCQKIFGEGEFCNIQPEV